MAIASAARGTNSVLNGLIIACNDDARAQEAAAAALTTIGSRKHRLEDAAKSRETFVHELSQLIRDLGGSPTSGGSSVEGAFAFLSAARFMVVGSHAGDRYSTCARVEDKAHVLYEHALKRELPDSVRSVLERQQTEIASDLEEWRRRRIG